MRTANIHASCVVLGRAGEAFGAPADAGVLLLGDSGAGKSDLALRLIAQGAVLVADDRCELFLRDEALWARPPSTLAGLIELRGVGIVTLSHAAEARIALTVQLVAAETVPRLPEPTRFAPPEILGAPPDLWRPRIALAAFEASTPAKIAAAVAAFAWGLFRDTGP
jgi:HPr kinase/phosphorylase